MNLKLFESLLVLPSKSQVLSKNPEKNQYSFSLQSLYLKILASSSIDQHSFIKYLFLNHIVVHRFRTNDAFSA